MKYGIHIFPIFQNFNAQKVWIIFQCTKFHKEPSLHYYIHTYPKIKKKSLNFSSGINIELTLEYNISIIKTWFCTFRKKGNLPWLMDDIQILWEQVWMQKIKFMHFLRLDQNMKHKRSIALFSNRINSIIKFAIQLTKEFRYKS